MAPPPISTPRTEPNPAGHQLPVQHTPLSEWHELGRMLGKHPEREDRPARTHWTTVSPGSARGWAWISSTRSATLAPEATSSSNTTTSVDIFVLVLIRRELLIVCDLGGPAEAVVLGDSAGPQWIGYVDPYVSRVRLEGDRDSAGASAAVGTPPA
jgi:hypothetical protein